MTFSDQETATEGRFEDWAFAGSEELENIHLECFDAKSYLKVSKSYSDEDGLTTQINEGLKYLVQEENKTNETKVKNNLFKEILIKSTSLIDLTENKNEYQDLLKLSLNLLIPEQNSNRVFPLKYSIGKDNNSDTETDSDIVSKRNKIYSNNLFQLVNQLSAFSLKEISLGDIIMHEEDSSKFDILLKVKGCLEINDVKHSSKTLSMEFKKEDISKFNDHLQVSLHFTSSSTDNVDNTFENFSISVLCDYNINDDQSPTSNLIRGKVDPNYQVSQNKYFFSSSRISSLYFNNFNLELVKKHKERSSEIDDLFYKPNNSQLTLIPYQKFSAYIKDGFHMLFEFDYQSRKVNYQVKHLTKDLITTNLKFDDYDWSIKHFYENFDHAK